MAVVNKPPRSSVSKSSSKKKESTGKSSSPSSSSKSSSSSKVVKEWKEMPPTILVVFPLVMIIGKIVGKIAPSMSWNDKLRMLGWCVVCLIAASCFLTTLFIKKKVGEQKDYIVCVDAASSSLATEKQKARGGAIEVSVIDYELSLVSSMQKPIGIGIAVSFLLPLLVGINQPIILQSIAMPVSLFRSRLFQSYVLKKKEAKTKNLEKEKLE